MKIYTKTGDEGTTSLFGGRRVSKAHARIEAYGLADHLNAQLGVVCLHVQPRDESGDLRDRLQRVQAELFNLGADLATPLDVQNERIVRLAAGEAEQLEREIDEMEATLSPLTTFILPGGTPAAAHLHVARTTCRQVERAVVLLADQEPINQHVATYLNRLSDWLFVLARVANERAGVADVAWVSPRAQSANGQAS